MRSGRSTARSGTSGSAPTATISTCEVTGEFARFVDDPYVEPGFTREPLTDETSTWRDRGRLRRPAGRARLREAGVEDLRIIEKGGDFGGTWYWNRYPGAQCDVESYIYLPLLEELGYVPKEKYTTRPEILAHSRAIGSSYDLYRDACFQTEVTEHALGRGQRALDRRDQPRTTA